MITPATLAQAHAALAHHARTFHLASRLLPRAQRDDAAVVYAFCRLVDDEVDEAPDADAARASLAAIEAELAGDQAPRPMVGAFLDVCARCAIAPQAAQELCQGIGSDLGAVRVADDAELLRYGYRVAGTVGLMMCGVLGVRAPAALPHAVDLGIGMQITNICRDVLEDATRGRVYLPAARLSRYGCTPEELLAAPASALAVTASAGVVRDLLVLAERYYTSGRDGLRYLPAAVRPAIAAAGEVYRTIGDHLRARGFGVMRGRTVASDASRLAALVRAVAATPLASLGPPAPHDGLLHRHLADLPGCAPA